MNYNRLHKVSYGYLVPRICQFLMKKENMSDLVRQWQFHYLGTYIPFTGNNDL
jgi:hypothetical protein